MQKPKAVRVNVDQLVVRRSINQKMRIRIPHDTTKVSLYSEIQENLSNDSYVFLSYCISNAIRHAHSISGC